MQEVMKRVNELYDMLTAKNKEADALSVKLAAQAKEQEATAKTQAEKDIELNNREVEVAKVEDILEVKRNNEAMLIKISQERESLANGISTHKTQVAKDKHEIEVREKGINDDFKTLKDAQAKLAEDQKQLEEDRKTYKEEIVRKIAEGVKV